MSLKIIGTRLVSPEVSGYHDKCAIVDQSNGMEIWSTDLFSTNPNPFCPQTQQKWPEVYAQLAAGNLSYECIRTIKHDKCLSLNVGGECATTRSNVNHDGRLVAFSCLIHCGYSSTWRGSMACCTMHPDEWEEFISHFQMGDRGVFQIVDGTN
jgi:hypothetical protein